MKRHSLAALALLVPMMVSAAEPSLPAPPPAAPAPPAAPVPAAGALPQMHFISSIAQDELYGALRAVPALSSLDKEMVGSPLTLLVTHTLRPTAGGQAAGLLSAMLSGGSLGIIPVVTNDRLVVKYEVWLNGKVLTSHAFERTATRAINIWSGGNDQYAGLGKSGFEWLQSTAAEAAAKLAADPALRAVRNEVDFYFPAPAGAPAAPVPPPAPATPASAP